METHSLGVGGRGIYNNDNYNRRNGISLLTDENVHMVGGNGGTTGTYTTGARVFNFQRSLDSKSCITGITDC